MRRPLLLMLGLALVVSSPAPGASAVGQDAANDWPHFLGPRYDGSIAAAVEAWTTTPDTVWRRPAGAGYAGPVVSGDLVVLFHRNGDEEVVEGLRIADGTTVWKTAYPTSYRDDFGFGNGPRAAPTIADGRVFTFGAQGVLQALELETGDLLWRIDTHDRFGVAKGYFGAAGSPLVDDGLVMLNVGGTDGAGVVAFDPASGDVRWQVTSDEASYSSGVPASLGGNRRAVFFTRTGLVAVDPARGVVTTELRWRSRSQASVNAASPLIIDDAVFLSACYGTGAILLRVEGDTLSEIWSGDRALSTHYATAVAHDGVLYGFDGALHLGPPSLRAVDQSSGEVLWSEDRYGGGAILRAGNRLLIQRDSGELVLAEASRGGYRTLASARILRGETRAYPAYAGGLWLARDERELVAVNLGGAGSR
jgi:outer membrane protein assembly factor BamB